MRKLSKENEDAMGMKIVDNVHLIKCHFKRPDWFSSACAILGETVTLIDVGHDFHPEEVIFPYLRHIGREPNEISMVILTHAHGDHCGGVTAIKKESGAKVAIHKLDKPFLEDPTLHSKRLHSRFPDFFPSNLEPDLHGVITPDLVLEDGDKITLDGHQLAVLHTPGHTGGCIVIEYEEAGLYVSGDSLLGNPFYNSIECINSFVRMNKEAVKILVTGHPFLLRTRPEKPFGAVFHGEEAKIFLQERLGVLKEAVDKISRIIQTSARPFSLSRIYAEYIQKYPQEKVSPMVIGTVLESLPKLRQDRNESDIEC